MGGVLQYEWEVYCWVSLSSRLRSQEGTAIQMGDVLPYKFDFFVSMVRNLGKSLGHSDLDRFTRTKVQN